MTNKFKHSMLSDRFSVIVSYLRKIKEATDSADRNAYYRVAEGLVENYRGYLTGLYHCDMLSDKNWSLLYDELTNMDTKLTNALFGH